MNPRGSTGYGLKFRAANVNDWGDGDYKDLMTGVDHVIEMGIADPNHLAVMGWSYGGYMTNWVIGQTTRFKAAATGAGLSNLISMWGTNDIPYHHGRLLSRAAGGATDRYLKMSPLFYVKNVTTPTLILHGEIDPRVPTSQGYEMYNGSETARRRDRDGGLPADQAWAGGTQVRSGYHAAPPGLGFQAHLADREECACLKHLRRTAL